MPINANAGTVMGWAKNLYKNGRGGYECLEEAIADSLAIARFSSDAKLIDVYEDMLDLYRKVDEELVLDYLFDQDRVTYNVLMD